MSVQDRGRLKLLFVDDEPNVLAGIRRILYRHRECFAAQFAGGGAEALEMIERERFDVVVSDMRMPGTDGAELLSRVKEVDPVAVRIVLSGQTDKHSALRAADVAHQFLAKPTAPGSLKAALDRSRELARLLPQRGLRAALGRLDRLPGPSVTKRSLDAAFAAPLADIAGVAGIVEADLGLSAKVLRVVNSAFFSLPSEICTVGEALSYLGPENVRALAAFPEEPDDAGPGKEAEQLAVELQARSTAVVDLARYVLHHPRRPGDLFLGALLHDIGVLAAAVLATQQLPSSPLDCELLPDAGPDELEALHAEIGAYLLCLWGFPRGAVEIVSRHHVPPVPADGDLTEAHAVFVAEALLSEAEQAPGHGCPVPLGELGWAGAAQLDDWRRYRDTLIGGTAR